MISFHKIIFLFVIVAFLGCESNQQSASDQLEALIQKFQDHEGYDDNEYPLGLFTKEYAKNEALFSQSIREELITIPTDDLNETERISVDLLKFVLQDQIDYYEFEQYLNPLLSDAGFHSDLTYMVRPFANYDQVKKYLKKLNEIPEFVDQNLVNLREGLKKGVSQPRVIFNGYESTYNDHIVENFEDNYYYCLLYTSPSPRDRS